jgi:DNA primase
MSKKLLRISQSKIDEIASAVDIVDIISQYTTLRKAGRSFMGRCPFHEEKTPSFSVSQEKGVYHCFGCGKSGNVFTFIMDMDNVPFSDAVKTLAEKANIKLEFEDENPQERNQIETLYEINKEAAKYFYENINSHDGIYAKEYLVTRGVKEEMLVKFGLGYSLRYKDSLFKKFEDKFSKEDFKLSGLVFGEENMKDKFRGRLMFPVFSESGRVVAFGARKLFDDDYVQAKYVNSPETKIYNKSKTLYGLNFAKNSIKEKGFVILVEGYLDLISLVQNGITNVVASSGTSLTELHVKILSRYTNEIVIVYDADTAGQNASRRAIELILAYDMSATIIVLPAGEDPDTYMQNFGIEDFKKLIDRRQSFINYIGEGYEKAGRLSNPEGISAFIHEVISLVAKIKDPIKQDLYIKDIAERFSIQQRLIEKELDKERLKNRAYPQMQEKHVPNVDRFKKEIEESEISETEYRLIRILVDSDIDTKEYIMNNLEIDFIGSKEVVKIVNYIVSNLNDASKITTVNLLNKFNDEITSKVISKALLNDNYVLDEKRKGNNISEAKAVIYHLRINNLEKRKLQLTSELKSPNTDSKITELQQKFQELQIEEAELKKQMRTKY